MNEWGKSELSELVRFRNGKSTKGTAEGAYPVYGSNGIIGTAARSMYTNAIILGRVGAYCGSVEYCPAPFWATDNTIVVEPLEHKLDVRFGYYLLLHAGLNRYAGGSAQPLLTQTNLRGVEFHTPPIDVQRRIAGILGAYDDLIKVNRRRAAVLEDMARGLFEEWFVRFRFPGHETVPILDTPDGPLPEGWCWGVFSDLVAEVRNSVHPSEIDADTVYLGLEHLPRRSTTLADQGVAEDVTSLKLRFQRGDILFGKIRPYFHKVVWAPVDGVCSSDAIVWRPVDEHKAQALAVASSDPFVNFSVQTSNGTKMPRANTRVLANYACAIAPAPLSVQFERTSLPMVEAAAAYQAANQRLAASRDLLLPRLMSGQLSVAAAERDLELA